MSTPEGGLPPQPTGPHGTAIERVPAEGAQAAEPGAAQPEESQAPAQPGRLEQFRGRRGRQKEATSEAREKRKEENAEKAKQKAAEQDAKDRNKAAEREAKAEEKRLHEEAVAKKRAEVRAEWEKEKRQWESEWTGRKTQKEKGLPNKGEQVKSLEDQRKDQVRLKSSTDPLTKTKATLEIAKLDRLLTGDTDRLLSDLRSITVPLSIPEGDRPALLAKLSSLQGELLVDKANRKDPPVSETDKTDYLTQAKTKFEEAQRLDKNQFESGVYLYKPTKEIIKGARRGNKIILADGRETEDENIILEAQRLIEGAQLFREELELDKKTSKIHPTIRHKLRHIRHPRAKVSKKDVPRPSITPDYAKFAPAPIEPTPQAPTPPEGGQPEQPPVPPAPRRLYEPPPAGLGITPVPREDEWPPAEPPPPPPPYRAPGKRSSYGLPGGEPQQTYRPDRRPPVPPVTTYSGEPIRYEPPTPRRVPIIFDHVEAPHPAEEPDASTEDTIDLTPERRAEILQNLPPLRRPTRPTEDTPKHEPVETAAPEADEL